MIATRKTWQLRDGLKLLPAKFTTRLLLGLLVLIAGLAGRYTSLAIAGVPWSLKSFLQAPVELPVQGRSSSPPAALPVVQLEPGVWEAWSRNASDESEEAVVKGMSKRTADSSLISVSREAEAVTSSPARALMDGLPEPAAGDLAPPLQDVQPAAGGDHALGPPGTAVGVLVKAGGGAAAGQLDVAGTNSNDVPGSRLEATAVQGRKWRTRFVREHTVEVSQVAACRASLPHFALNTSLNGRRVATLGNLRRPGQRVLLYLPRHGLGNSLRGYVSAYVYAVITGRQLVRFHGSSHGRVLDSLCEAFRCSFEAIRCPKGEDPMEFHRVLGSYRPLYIQGKSGKDLRRSLLSTNPIVVAEAASMFDGYWLKDKLMRACIFRAFDCRTLWCVRSRAMFDLLRGGPSDALVGAVADVLQVHEYRSSEGAGANAVAQASLQTESSVESEFDLALHIRTRTSALEADLCRMPCNRTQDQEERLLHQQKREAYYLGDDLWGCVEQLVEQKVRVILGEGRAKSPLRIFLATDNEALRPTFIKRLERLGVVYYSSGRVVHTSKAKGSGGALPTLAEWYLLSKADVVLGVDTYISTFAYFASLYGNTTLAGVRHRWHVCKLRLEHRAKPVPRPPSGR